MGCIVHRVQYMGEEKKGSFLYDIRLKFFNMFKLPLKKKYRQAILITVVLIFLLLSISLAVTLLSREKNTEVESLKNRNQLIVLISIDGLGSNLVNENAPFLSSLLEDQSVSYTLDMQTLEQSETMPSHVSMVTGLKQENHGFYLNSLSSDIPPIEEKTLFDYALENDYSFYTFLTKDKLLYLLGEKTGENIVSNEEYSSEIMGEVDELVETESTKVFVFLHFRDIDSSGHTYGWGSNEQQDALRTLDKNLELLTNDLRQEFDNYDRYFIFTADHGGEGVQHSNGCENCRRIPFIVLSENISESYKTTDSMENIYDTTCVVLDIMGDSLSRDIDCRR